MGVFKRYTLDNLKILLRRRGEKHMRHRFWRQQVDDRMLKRPLCSAILEVENSRCVSMVHLYNYETSAVLKSQVLMLESRQTGWDFFICLIIWPFFSDRDSPESESDSSLSRSPSSSVSVKCLDPDAVIKIGPKGWNAVDPTESAYTG